MRFFPSASRQRVSVAVVAAVITVGAAAIPIANADDDLKDKQKKVEGQIASAADHLDETSKAVSEASTRLEAAQTQLTDARRELAGVRVELKDARTRDAEMQGRLAEAEEKLETAVVELEEGQDALDDQRTEVKETVVRLYTRGDPRLLALTSYLHAGSMEELMSREATESIWVGRESQSYDDLGVAEDQLQTRKDDVKTATDDVAVKRQEAADNLATISTLFDETQVAEQRVDDLVAGRRDARQDAVKAREGDRAVLARLKKREETIKKQILAAAAETPGKTYDGATGGFLNYPSAGSVTSPFGYRTHPIYGYYGLHDGTDFGAGCGSALWAGADGTVTNTYYDEVYGNRLYLSVGTVNGANLTLVYNHMSGYNVTEGDTVGRGDVVGYVGDTGWSTGCHLHFTVLRNGEPVDPMGYF